MKVVTAVKNYAIRRGSGDVLVFLAGGITNCWEWQDAVIEELSRKPNTDHLVIFNPRRKNFPIDDPNASQEQIEWEFDNLERCDIFSMYFCEGDSDQPICMYELGRNIALKQSDIDEGYGWFDKIEDCVVISCEEGYRRKADVLIQTQLATGSAELVEVSSDPGSLVESHADRIYKAYLKYIES